MFDAHHQTMAADWLLMMRPVVSAGAVHAIHCDLLGKIRDSCYTPLQSVRKLAFPDKQEMKQSAAVDKIGFIQLSPLSGAI